MLNIWFYLLKSEKQHLLKINRHNTHAYVHFLTYFILKDVSHFQDVLIETDNCKKPEVRPTQTCPEFNREGFYFTDEFSADWDNLNQTKVLIFHAWIAEYATVDRY